MKELKEDDVTERIVTNATPWWSRWFPFLGGTEWFDVNTWQADLRRITRVYEARGYYQARVLEDLVTETGTGAVTLKVKLKEGVPATLRTLDLRGLGQTPDLEPRLRARVPLKLGDVFLEEGWALTKAGLVSQLHEEGYAEAKVEGEAVVDLDANTLRGVVVAPFVEELFFRGALYTALGRTRPVLISTVLYVIATSASGNPMLGFAAVILGTVCALERRATGGVLAPAMVMLRMALALPP